MMPYLLSYYSPVHLTAVVWGDRATDVARDGKKESMVFLDGVFLSREAGGRCRFGTGAAIVAYLCQFRS